ALALTVDEDVDRPLGQTVNDKPAFRVRERHLDSAVAATQSGVEGFRTGRNQIPLPLRRLGHDPAERMIQRAREPGDTPMTLRRPSGGVRALMVVVALRGWGLFAYQEVRRRDPIYRAVRALERGDSAARLQAAKDLTLMGPNAAEAAPALAEAVRRDADANVR